MSGNRDEAVRTRAYAIWEAEGFPHGHDAQHWEQAAREVDEAQAEAAAAPDTKPAARKPAARKPR